MSDEPKVTIACCYGSPAKFRDFEATLKTQTCPYELIGLENEHDKNFSSCSSAYNSIINQVKTKYVIFSHCDILLSKPDHLAKFVSYLEQTERDDILGVVGVKFASFGLYSNIRHYMKQVGQLVDAGRLKVEGEMMECDTLDECFFGGHTSHFQEYPLDEEICDNWHLYAVEACLRTKSKYVRGGGHVYVCDVDLIHLSTGTIDKDFLDGFKKLCRKYSDQFPFIRTPCISSRTDRFHVALCTMCKIPFNRFRSKAIYFLGRIGLYHKIKKFLQKTNLRI